MKDGPRRRGDIPSYAERSVAVGAAAGAGLIAESGLLDSVVIAADLCSGAGHRINRIPIDEEAGEAAYEVRPSATLRAADYARRPRSRALECVIIRVADVETDERGDETAEIVAKSLVIRCRAGGSSTP